jgi:hypothetical protein
VLDIRRQLLNKNPFSVIHNAKLKYIVILKIIMMQNASRVWKELLTKVCVFSHSNLHKPDEVPLLASLVFQNNGFLKFKLKIFVIFEILMAVNVKIAVLLM